jgi:hypothetical protein
MECGIEPGRKVPRNRSNSMPSNEMFVPGAGMLMRVDRASVAVVRVDLLFDKVSRARTWVTRAVESALNIE